MGYGGFQFLVSDSKKDHLEERRAAGKPDAKVLRLGLISIASAVAGGLTVAWWYRKTLSKLQNPIDPPAIPQTISEDDIDSL